MDEKKLTAILLFIDVLSIIFLIIFLILSSKKKKKKQKSNPISEINNTTLPEEQLPQPPGTAISAPNPIINYKYIYEPKWLLTYNEKNAYKKIDEIIKAKNYYVFPKVRLLDLIQPRDLTNKKYLWKIQAKHVDFVICNERLVAKWIIELQDNSHQSKDRQERDQFIFDILKPVVILYYKPTLQQK